MSAITRRVVAEEAIAIASGSDTSGLISIESAAVGLVLASSAWASNLSAAIHLSNDGVNFYPINGGGITLVAGEWVKITEAAMYGKYLRFVLGANAAQAETLTVCLKG